MTGSKDGRPAVASVFEVQEKKERVDDDGSEEDSFSDCWKLAAIAILLFVLRKGLCSCNRRRGLLESN